ncbi:MAG: RNA-binding transcriptional accessory protein, partial [Sandaracinaceae bacterium]|nr:RNA-binding transcriptional accessory protein [Sandaracinaceae bacterium]
MSTDFDPVPSIAVELSIAPANVAAAVKLLAEGATVPFIARYRKEVTGGLDEVQIRAIEERRAYLLELDERRRAILASIEEQGKLTAELRAKIEACTTKAALEDLYLPYKPKRRTRAMITRERGLEPLALRILEQPAIGDPRAEAAAFVKGEVEDAEAALSGARDIVAELVAESADVRALVREAFEKRGVLKVEAVKSKINGPTKFEQYYEFSEPVATIPSHRFLAIRRGEGEGILRAWIEVDAEELERRIAAMQKLDGRSPFADELRLAVRDALKRLLAPSVENDVRVEVKMRSDRAAVEVFADNLQNLLLAAPLGTRKVIGVDPGLRTGCKCAAVDATGKLIGHVTIYPTQRPDQAARELAAFVREHRPEAIAVGNGTGGR